MDPRKKSGINQRGCKTVEEAEQKAIPREINQFPKKRAAKIFSLFQACQFAIQSLKLPV
jgi:hypothetical protein